jgi:hypothetical protein
MRQPKLPEPNDVPAEASALTADERVDLSTGYTKDVVEALDRQYNEMVDSIERMEQKTEKPSTSLEDLVQNMTVPDSVGQADFVTPPHIKGKPESVRAEFHPAPYAIPRADEAGKIHPQWLPGGTGDFEVVGNDGTKIRVDILHGLIVGLQRYIFDLDKNDWIKEHGQ